MVSYIVGVPGSGKTAKAVYDIQKLSKKVEKDGSKTYTKIYNNIAGFKHELLEDSYKWVEDNFAIFIKSLHKLYNDNKKYDNLDDILIELCKKEGYYRSLIVIDECHNTFNSKIQKEWVWLLSYHRHIYLDFIFITQSMAMIPDAKLKNMAEIYIKAQPATKRIFGSSFRYHFYENSRMSNNVKYKTESLKMTDEVFNLYQSGDGVKAKSIVRKYILLFFLAIVIVIFVGFYAYNRVFPSKIKEEPKIAKIVKKETDSKFNIIHDNDIKENRFNDDEVYFETITCIEKVCNLDNYWNVPFNYLKYFIDSGVIEVLTRTKTTHRTIYYTTTTKVAYNALKNYKIKLSDDEEKFVPDKPESNDFDVSDNLFRSPL